MSEHEGRLLCAGCLAALALESAEASRPKARKSWLGPLLRNVLACFVGWLLFFLVCKLIVRIPHDFHDGVSAPTFEETW